MTAPETDAPVTATRIRVLNAHGEFGAPERVGWAGGIFSVGGAASGGSAPNGSAPDSSVLDGTGLWMVPGLVDAHAHIAWHSFNEVDRAGETPEQRDASTEAVLGKMLRAGFTSVRDAGGFDPQTFATRTHSATVAHSAKVAHSTTAPSSTTVPSSTTAPQAQPLPRTQASVELIGRDTADAAGGVLAATERALSRGARWVKLIGTASVASPPGAGLEPHFTAAEQRAVVARAAEVGAGVMLHAWGGSAIDDAIDAGVMSIEHGIFMTTAQAARAADAGMTLVPTLLIYRHVQRMIESGALPKALAKRVAEAVAAHPASVRTARDAGLAIALGTDFSTPQQHGTNRTEFDALVAAGLSTSEALIAATRAGAELMARVAEGPAPSGSIAEGEIADAVIFDRDPLAAASEGQRFSAFNDPHSVVAVIIGGRHVNVAGTAWAAPFNTSNNDF